MTTEKLETLEDLREFITASMESRTVPDRVSEWCARNAGKGLRKNNLPEGTTISQRYTMTNLVTPEYYRNEGNAGYSFLLSHKIVNVVVPTVSELREKNPQYYAGLEERNAKRLELVNNHEDLRALLYNFNTLRYAARMYREAAHIYEETYNVELPDYYALRKLAGWIEERR